MSLLVLAQNLTIAICSHLFCIFLFPFSDSTSTVDLLIEYFKRFGDKHCCFWDLQPYLHVNLPEILDKEKVTTEIPLGDPIRRNDGTVERHGGMAE